jgi:hypothetical protein
MNARTRSKIYRRSFLTGLGALVLGWLMSRMPDTAAGKAYWPWVMLAGGVVWLTMFLVWQHGRGASAGVLRRWSARSTRNQGVASAWSILRIASGWAMRSRAGTYRPSIRALPWWRRVFVPARAVATPLARVGWFLKIWSPCEDVTARVGGPRAGKTGELACRLLDAQGAVLATSTRTDLCELTAEVRSKVGPLYVYNPSNVGGLDSTIAFDPLTGCRDPKTASDRAGDLLRGADAGSGGIGGEREYWIGQARRVLAVLMHAAALGGWSMSDVSAWVADPRVGAPEITRSLRNSRAPAYLTEAEQFLSLNDRTRTSICATIMPALNWLIDPVAAACTEPTADGSRVELDVETLLARRGTVYLLGAEEAQVTPLVTALTGHIAREARRLAGLAPGGRLDPPLTLVLDEAALICPVPLDKWTADMGGRGIPIHIGAQSRAQLRQRYGDTGAAAIMNNAATLMVFGGTRDSDDLAAYSTLAGDRLEIVETWDADHKVTSSSTRRVPVLTPAQIAQLPPKRVMVVRRGLPVCVGKAQMVWERDDYRWAQLGVRVRERIAQVEAIEARLAQRWQRLGEQFSELIDALGQWAAPRLAAAVAKADEWMAERRDDRAARKQARAHRSRFRTTRRQHRRVTRQLQRERAKAARKQQQQRRAAGRGRGRSL